MLIEFSVANFRSFRERQTLSMVAAPRLKRRENTFKPELDEVGFPALLKVCAIYGPNASGKTNLLLALDAAQRLCDRSSSDGNRLHLLSPFALDSSLRTQPSEFEIHFIHSRVRYQFELHATSDRILLERLISFPRGKETLLYERRYEDGGEVYAFGDTLEGGSDVHETWKKLTSPVALFISQAVANSSEELDQLKKPHDWLTEGVSTLIYGMQSLAGASQRLASKRTSNAEAIAAFLREFDVPISQFRSEEQSKLSRTLSNLSASAYLADNPVETKLTHYSALGEAELGFADESEGTKNLIGFWLPWTTREYSEFSPQRVLVIDELDSSLHPEIVAALIARHNTSAVPTQLIFTTHDTHLMDAKILRRDQFWITERDMNGATKLRSIHDFVGREGEDIEKRYFEGRYRGLPLVKRRLS